MKQLSIILLLLSILYCCNDNSEYLYRIVVNNKIGFINKKGNIITKPLYDYYDYPKFDWHRYYENDVPYNKRLFVKTPIFNYGDPFAEGLAIVKLQDKWGFINTKGELVVDTKYDEALPFKEGRAAVRIADKWGYINYKGKEVIPIEYEEAYYFFERRAWVKKNGKYGFIDQNGKAITPFQYDFYHENSRSISARKYYGFREGMAEIIINNKSGFMNLDGKMVIKPQYDYCTDFHLGYSSFQINGLDGIMNKKENHIIKPEYNYVGVYDNAPIPFSYEEYGKRGYLTIDGDIIITPQFSSAYMFTDGLAPVEMEVKGKKKWGYINTKGEFVIEPIYDYVKSFDNGIAIVTLFERNDESKYLGKSLCGCIDKKGNYVIPLIEYEIQGFYEDVAIVTYYEDIFTQKYGLVDTNGEIVLEAKYNYIGPFIDGIAEVWITVKAGEFIYNEETNETKYIEPINKYGYINKQGEYVWEPK